MNEHAVLLPNKLAHKLHTSNKTSGPWWCPRREAKTCWSNN